jgi:hypothetical protein
MADETPFVLMDDYLAQQPPPGVGPDQVRSLYAKFNPDKLHDPNLLAANRAPTPFSFVGEDRPLVDPKDGGEIY